MTALRLESMRQDTIQVAQNGCIHGSHWMTMSTQALLPGTRLLHLYHIFIIGST